MADSILNSIKKVLGIDATYTVFDVDIIIHINSAFSTLTQLGVGPAEGFMIQDAVTTWDTFLLGDIRLNAAIQYVGLKVRLAFDPPQNSFTIDSIKELVKELEWRLNVAVDPGTADSLVYDGGVP